MNLTWCKKGGSRGYVTTKPLEWHIGAKGSGLVVTVPEEWEFESSVPYALRWLWSVDDPFFLKSAAIHDYLLEEKKWRPATCDTNWYEAALSCQAPRPKTEIAFLGMRIRRLFQWAFGLPYLTRH